MPYKDIEAKRQYWREWYHKSGASKKYVAKAKHRKDSIRQWMRELKHTLACVRCSENHPATLEFHHINSDKDFNLFEAAKRGMGRDRILKEIAKCVVLCANCHKKEHYANIGHQTQGGSPVLETGY